MEQTGVGFKVPDEDVEISSDNTKILADSVAGYDTTYRMSPARRWIGAVLASRGFCREWGLGGSARLWRGIAGRLAKCPPSHVHQPRALLCPVPPYRGDENDAASFVGGPPRAVSAPVLLPSFAEAHPSYGPAASSRVAQPR